MKLRPHLTYANVVSSLCLFILLGGSAYAVTQIDPNSVGTKQLKANAVKTGKIANKTIKREDAVPGAFATPQQVANKLGVGATAANSAKLGGILPSGFLQGTGSTLSTDYDRTNDGTALTVPGGKVTVDCGASGYGALFEATAGSWDLFQFSYRDQAPGPAVSHVTRNPNDVFIFAFTKEEGVLQIDAKSSQGQSISLTIYSRYDDTTDHCIGRIRGMLFPS